MQEARRRDPAPVPVMVCRKMQADKTRSPIKQPFSCVSDAMVDARTWNDSLEPETVSGRREKQAINRNFMNN